MSLLDRGSTPGWLRDIKATRLCVPGIDHNGTSAALTAIPGAQPEPNADRSWSTGEGIGSVVLAG